MALDNFACQILAKVFGIWYGNGIIYTILGSSFCHMPYREKEILFREIPNRSSSEEYVNLWICELSFVHTNKLKYLHIFICVVLSHRLLKDNFLMFSKKTKIFVLFNILL